MTLLCIVAEVDSLHLQNMFIDIRTIVFIGGLAVDKHLFALGEREDPAT